MYIDRLFIHMCIYRQRCVYTRLDPEMCIGHGSSLHFQIIFHRTAQGIHFPFGLHDCRYPLHDCHAPTQLTQAQDSKICFECRFADIILLAHRATTTTTITIIITIITITIIIAIITITIIIITITMIIIMIIIIITITITIIIVCALPLVFLR